MQNLLVYFQPIESNTLIRIFAFRIDVMKRSNRYEKFISVTDCKMSHVSWAILND